MGKRTRKREKVMFDTHTHAFGVLLGFPSLLCSHAVASAGRPSTECVSHSIRCWEAVRLSALVFDIPHLSGEAGQPCHSNVKHMWSRPTHRTERSRGWTQPPWPLSLWIRINSTGSIESAPGPPCFSQSSH